MVVQGLTLGDDYSGTIGRLALQVSPLLLTPENADKRHAYECLLRSCSADARITVLTDDGALTAVQAWLSTINPSIEVVGVADKKVSTSRTWMRDAFLSGRQDGVVHYFKTQIGKMGGGQADWLAAKYGTATLAIDDVYLDGGDSMVGPDFRLVGVQAVYYTQDIAGHACNFSVAVERIQALDPRPVTVVGYRPRALRQQRLWFVNQIARRIENARRNLPSQKSIKLPWSAWIFSRSVLETMRLLMANDLMEDWAHIDVVVSITGQKVAGKNVVLVAETPVSNTTNVDEILEKDRLDALAAHLVASGFNVIRNPAPFARLTLWYNNTILQSEPPTVWLPQYVQPDGSFADTDRANAEIWTRLGYQVIGVPGWLTFVADGGAIRCATIILERHSNPNAVTASV